MAALTTEILARTIFGNKRVHIGKTTCSGTSGEIDTGLRSVEAIVLTPAKASVVADAVTLNEDLPCDGSAVTVIYTSGTSYIYWIAIGY